MKDYIIKFKKFGMYGLMAVGVLTVAWFVLSIFLGGLSSSRSSPQYRSDGLSFAQPLSTSGPSFDFLDVFSGAAEFQGNVESPQQISEGELTKRKVIKNGSLSLLVKKAEEVAESIQSIAERLNGFVQSSQVYEISSGVKSGSVTIRVPADRFNEAMDEIKALAVKVERETTNASDVTEQFIDLEARLLNLKAEEAQYLEIMKSADTVEDTLKVVQRLQSARGRIEQIEGQLKYLSRQVDMSTISVSLTSEADLEVFGIRWRPLFVMKQAFRDMLSGLTGYVDAMINIIFRLPVLILWVVTISLFAAVGWRIFRLILNKFFKRHSP